jgi:hypothetical protein
MEYSFTTTKGWRKKYPILGTGSNMCARRGVFTKKNRSAEARDRHQSANIILLKKLLADPRAGTGAGGQRVEGGGPCVHDVKNIVANYGGSSFFWL